MPQANRVDPRVKQLKGYFAAINESPRLAKESPLLLKANLEHLAAHLHISADQLDTTPDEQIRRVGKALTLWLFLSEYKRENPDQSFLQGLLFFWHSYLAPISPSHPAPAISSVIAHCADISQLREFLQEARRWANVTFAENPDTLRMMLGLLTPENLRKMFVGGLPPRPTDSERRTFGNYLNTATREVALKLESLVPDLFVERAPIVEKVSEEPKQLEGMAIVTSPGAVIQVHPPGQVSWIVQHMISPSFRLSGVGAHNLRVDGYLERPMESEVLRGRARAPSFIASADVDLKGMSGFLSGGLGSGRTAFLKFLTYKYSREYLRKNDGVVAYYFSARDFVLHARNRRSIHDFIADSLAALGGDTEGIEDLPEMLRALDRAGKLLLLVDDLDRLSDAEQSEVLSQLTFSPAVVFAVLPWQVERLASTTPRSHLGVFTLLPLTVQEQLELLARMSYATEAVYDQSVAEQLLRELPDLAQMPLGVITILDELQSDWTDATQVVEMAFQEYLRRAGFPPVSFRGKDAEFSNEWFHLRSAAFDLLLTLKEYGGYERLKGETDVTVRRDMVENPNGYAWSMNWAQVARTGLFRPVLHLPGDRLALVNRDLTCHLLAQVARERHWNLHLPPRSLHPQAIRLLQRAERHLENLNNPNRGFDIRQLTPLPRVQEPPPKPKSKSWRALFPEIFRILS